MCIRDRGKVIGEAFRLVDETGVVMMETNEQPETVVELIEGVQYDQALKNNHFITNVEKGTAELENPLVLIVESVIPNVRKIQSVLEFIIKNGKSLLIIADVDPQVVSALAMNKKKGNIKVNIIDAPIYGISKKDVLSDLCAVTGATLVNEDLGDDMDIIEPEHLGSCLKSITNHEETILQVDLSDKKEVKDTIELDLSSLSLKADIPEHPNIVKIERLLEEYCIEYSSKYFYDDNYIEGSSDSKWNDLINYLESRDSLFSNRNVKIGNFLPDIKKIVTSGYRIKIYRIITNK